MKVPRGMVVVVIIALVVAVQSQPAPAPLNSVAQTESPNAGSGSRRNDKDTILDQPTILEKKSFSSFQSQFSKPLGYSRGSKYILPQRPADSSFAPVKNLPYAARAEAAGNVGFVRTNGTNFVLNGKIKYFSGSNDYFLIMRCYPPLNF